MRRADRRLTFLHSSARRHISNYTRVCGASGQLLHTNLRACGKWQPGGVQHVFGVNLQADPAICTTPCRPGCVLSRPTAFRVAGRASSHEQPGASNCRQGATHRVGAVCAQCARSTPALCKCTHLLDRGATGGRGEPRGQPANDRHDLQRAVKRWWPPHRCSPGQRHAPCRPSRLLLHAVRLHLGIVGGCGGGQRPDRRLVEVLCSSGRAAGGIVQWRYSATSWPLADPALTELQLTGTNHWTTERDTGLRQSLSCCSCRWEGRGGGAGGRAGGGAGNTQNPAHSSLERHAPCVKDRFIAEIRWGEAQKTHLRRSPRAAARGWGHA